ncbi:MAG: anaerobic glycerol-3-phosphate dehydrogenase subunit GlpA [Chloroflexota bacterium]|nr:anaerobic glycerol-3-phosphate dehydrogenase subunit GlpA [Chloroflexota bacterium]
MMECDVLIIGGGATGGGIAWDLALRGVRVILAEMGDLATGTSGRYHGLLHSGARYAVRDPESAKECIDENIILRRVAPEAVEDTGGYFVLCPGDDSSYVDRFLRGCADSGIPTREVSLSEALRRERVLNPRLEAVYEVPDGSCDSWDLLHGLQRGARETGRAEFLTYHKVETFHRTGDQPGDAITGARLLNLRTGESIDVTAAITINATGPWAAQVGALAGVSFKMRLSRGAMLAFNIRWVNTVINKLRAPGDGDIFVPVGTVSVIGTTSVTTDDPGDTRVDRWEVERILDEAEAMTPGISRARILRAWGGVRPLYDPGGDGRGAKRTFTALDHGVTDGVPGLISILGGKLTTYRLMAEKVADLVCAQLGITIPCATATTVLPGAHAPYGNFKAESTIPVTEALQAAAASGADDSRLHRLRDRLDALEHGDNPSPLICECEIVTDAQIRAALAGGDAHTLHDLRRDLRLGMGPCQGGFCAYRACGIRHDVTHDTPEGSMAVLTEFAERRFLGMKPLLWGHNLRQALLAEHLYGRIIGITSGDAPTVQTTPDWSNVRIPRLTLNGGRPPRIVIVGGGLAGLTAAWVSVTAGARVELLAQGQGALTLHPGWIETGDVVALSGSNGHPYAHAGESLALGLDAIDSVTRLESSPAPGQAIQAITASGSLRSVAFTVGAPYPTLHGRRVLVVGFAGWRDFYAGWCADRLRASGIDAAAVEIPFPIRLGNFDTWTVDAANWIDTDTGLSHLIDTVKPRRDGADVVAFPAVLGFRPEIRAWLADALGAHIVEIPTLTPSVPGLRLYHALRRALLAAGVRFTIGTTVEGLAFADDGERASGVYAETAAHGRARFVPGDAIVLATGGLFGGGIDSDYKGNLLEGVAALPIPHAPDVTAWWSQPFLSGRAQPIHRVGVITDGTMRPITEAGGALAINLFAAGRLLAGYSPVAEGSTEGVDLATGAAAAVGALQSVGLA